MTSPDQETYSKPFPARGQAIRTPPDSGKPIAVLLSPTEYEWLQQMEDLYWIARAQASESAGEWIGHEESVKLLTQRLQQQA